MLTHDLRHKIHDLLMKLLQRTGHYVTVLQPSRHFPRLRVNTSQYTTRGVLISLGLSIPRGLVVLFVADEIGVCFSVASGVVSSCEGDEDVVDLVGALEELRIGWLGVSDTENLWCGRMEHLQMMWSL